MKYLKISSVHIILLLLLFAITFVFSNEQDALSANARGDESAISLLFLIDHSGSMSGQGSNNAQDRWGERFKVPHALIDSIHKLFDSSEVSVVVFQKYLYFDPVDDEKFVQAPGVDTGAFLPLFQLNKSYPPEGKMGYEIIKEYLDYDTVTGGMNDYVDLKYVPSNLSMNGGNTNITAGFEAAKHAFTSARYPKNRQFIIFFSDGVATWPPPQGGTLANKFIEDAKTGMPTTFTIYFTQDPDPPIDLVEMTDNIKNNDYSTMNDSSALWAIDLGQQSLMDFILLNIFNIISTSVKETQQDLPTKDFMCYQMNDQVRILLPRGNSPEVQVDIFDVNGKVIHTIKQSHGSRNEIVWDYKDNSGKGVSSGIYVIRLNTGEKTLFRKIVVNR